jgi:tRNA-uridine 2-sulfurtransferase
MFDLMKKYKFNYIATGHYSRTVQQSSAFPFRELSSRNSSKPSFSYKLREAKDKTKDQSYFLYKLASKDLAKIVFPLGNFEKSEVKKIAKKLKLPVAKDESQDICFLQNTDINLFLKKYIRLKPGNITGGQGNVLGKHKGLPLYTIGQRKGIEIGGSGPYFVTEKNIRKNELIVSNDPKKLLTKKFAVNKAFWMDRETKFPLVAQVQIRYHAQKFSATIKKGEKGAYAIETKKLLRAVTPGQSAVFYKNEEVLGGGIITRNYNFP